MPTIATASRSWPGMARDRRSPTLGSRSVRADARILRSSTGDAVSARQVGVKRYPEEREIFITADGRQQQLSIARMEASTAARRRQARHRDPRQPLPAGDEQVEQGRAQAVLVHLDQLARPTTSHLRDNHLPHRQHDQPRRARRACLDRRNYTTSKKVSAKELRALKIERHSFHGDWNYVVKPRNEMR